MGDSMLEKEYKFMLTKEEYETIKKLFIWEKSYVQTNFYYFDNEGYLQKNHITVRVRAMNNRFYLQTKTSLTRNGALYVNEERCKEIEGAPETINAQLLEGMVEGWNGDVHYTGKLSTERKIYKVNGCELCLDRNDYLGKTDYELEIEFINELDEDLIRVLENNKIRLDYKSQAAGKKTRFLQRLQGESGVNDCQRIL